MSPADAEDYLGRPEGRRMSKVWRQVFGGMACACQNAACGVRRLFAMLGVDESPVPHLPRTSSGIRRRPSRPHKAEDGDRPGASPGASAHSRKSSVSGANDGPRSPTPSRARDALAAEGGPRSRSASASRQSSAEPQPPPPINGPSAEGGGKSHGSRKRKPGNPAAAQRTLSDGSGSDSDCDSGDGPQNQCGSRNTSGSDMPLKKLWISRYLEHVEAQPSASGSDASERGADEQDAHEPPSDAVCPPGAPPVKPLESVGRAIVKSAPKDADAPTP
ncbi:hypothetical protein IWQ57_006986, partial [Coemansia nantahalensis]